MTCRGSGIKRVSEKQAGGVMASAAGRTARRDEGAYSKEICDRGATKPGGLPRRKTARCVFQTCSKAARIAMTTPSTCSAAKCGPMGRLNTLEANCSAIGKLPWTQPSPEYAPERCGGTG